MHLLRRFFPTWLGLLLLGAGGCCGNCCPKSNLCDLPFYPTPGASAGSFRAPFPRLHPVPVRPVFHPDQLPEVEPDYVEPPLVRQMPSPSLRTKILPPGESGKEAMPESLAPKANQGGDQVPPRGDANPLRELGPNPAGDALPAAPGSSPSRTKDGLSPPSSTDRSGGPSGGSAMRRRDLRPLTDAAVELNGPEAAAPPAPRKQALVRPSRVATQPLASAEPDDGWRQRKDLP